MERQFLWMVSSVLRRISKGCLAMVEGTWFDEMCALSELSSATDDVGGPTTCLVTNRRL